MLATTKCLIQCLLPALCSEGTRPGLTSWAIFFGAAMKLGDFIAAIERAVQSGDSDTVRSIAQRLADSYEAMQILRAKGYGTTGMDLAALVKLVPSDKPGE